MEISRYEWMDPLAFPEWEESARLLALSMYIANDEEKPLRMLRQYREDGELSLIGLASWGRLAGIAGYRVPEQGDAELLHLAVRPELRGCGVGGRLVTRCLQGSRNGVLRAETDAEAVGFYAKLGFVISSLGEKYPGVERFGCTLRR